MDFEDYAVEYFQSYGIPRVVRGYTCTVELVGRVLHTDRQTIYFRPFGAEVI